MFMGGADASRLLEGTYAPPRKPRASKQSLYSSATRSETGSITSGKTISMSSSNPTTARSALGFAESKQLLLQLEKEHQQKQQHGEQLQQQKQQNSPYQPAILPLSPHLQQYKEQNPQIKQLLSLASEFSRFSQKEITIIRTTWCDNVANDSATASNVSTTNATMKPMPKPTSSMFASHHFWREVYDYLLSAHPDLKNILPSIKHQTVSFSGIVYTAIMNLENLSVMDIFLESLGRKHARVFGAEPIYFEHMGTAFIDALANRFGEEFSPDVEAAWIKLYCFLSNSIIQSGTDDLSVIDNSQDELDAIMTTTQAPNEVQVQPKSDSQMHSQHQTQAQLQTRVQTQQVYNKKSFMDNFSDETDSVSDTLVSSAASSEVSENSIGLKKFASTKEVNSEEVSKGKRSLFSFRSKLIKH